MERSRSYSEKTSSQNPSAYVTDLRCHSASYVSSYAPPKEANKVKKAKSAARPSSASSAAAATAAGSKARIWSGISDPELQRKRRVAGYSVYSMEGKMKGFLKSRMRWLKGKCPRVVDGWW